MAWRRAVVDELARTPMAVVLATLSLLSGLAGIGLNYLQYKSATPAPAISGAVASGPLPVAASISPGITALAVIVIFFAITPALAGIVGFLYRIKKIFGVMMSVPVAGVSIFLNMLNIRFLGYRPATPVASQAIDNLLFWGTLTVFLTVILWTMIRDFVVSTRSRQSSSNSSQDSDGSESGGDLMGVIILLAIWGGMLSWTQARLGEAFPF